MKLPNPTLAIALCILFPICVRAQKDIPSFGKIDKADLEMKDCSFDKAAEAMVLFDVAEVYCFFDLNTSGVLTSQLERHVRIKIFNKKGLGYANIRIPFITDDNAEQIKNVSAQTINLDASGNTVISKVDKASIYTKKLTKRRSEIVLAFPEVKDGSIIEYKYKDEADQLYALRTWYFQRSIPVKLSRYILNFPTTLGISAQPQGGLIVNMKETNEANRNIKAFSMTEVPALRDESYISCDEDYLQKVVPFLVSLDLPGTYSRSMLRTWPGIVKELVSDDYFGMQLKKNIPRTSDLDIMLANISDKYRKMQVIYDYVRKNMVWNNTYGIWALDGVKSAWKDKKGTTGEINLILVNLLRDADIDACPILLSSRDNGRVNTALADYDQFDKVMANVSIDGKTYVLDATNKYTPVGLIPFDVVYSEGLAIEKYDTYKWGWRSLFDNDHSMENYTLIEASIDDKGSMKGEARVTSVDYSRLARIPLLSANREKFIENYFGSKENNMKVDSLTFNNVDIDSLPLIQSCRFSQDISGSGGYNYFSANLFSGLEKNPFIADTRISDVFFGVNQFYSVEGTFTIPAGYSFDALPKNTRLRLPDTSVVFSRYASVSGQKLSVRMELEFKRPIYAAEDYEGFHEFYKKLFAMLNEQYVYKKN